MNDQPAIHIDRRPGRLFSLALLSIVVGAGTGLVGAAFRILLVKAELLRTYLLACAHNFGGAGVLLVVCSIALVGAFAARLVFRFAPQAAGSGIPQVEHELKVGWSGNTLSTVSTVIAKFVGGVLAIGGGFALGREGPTVQIGGGIGHLIGRAFQRESHECQVLLAAGAGAGLTTAFNAPVAGAVFVLEELVGSFNVSVTFATLGASASAICVSRFFVGQAPDFRVPAFDLLNFGALPVSIVCGIVMGFVGVVYNRVILAALRLSLSFDKLSGGLRAAAIGALIGLIGWFAPSLVGGGDLLTQQTLDGSLTSTALVSIFLVRFLLGPVSYAARTPGGLFAPMLVIGSQAGFLLLAPWSHIGSSATVVPAQFAIVGMAGLFAAVVRAPLTGIVLAAELTGSYTLLLPMVGAAFAATATASILNEPPIYDSLRSVK
jgi:chloride channel protein, CIC family